MINIEDNVPIPSDEKMNEIRASLKVLKIGQSFVCFEGFRHRLHPTAKRIGIKIVTRKVTRGIRIWRVE